MYNMDPTHGRDMLIEPAAMARLRARAAAYRDSGSMAGRISENEESLTFTRDGGILIVRVTGHTCHAPDWVDAIMGAVDIRHFTERLDAEAAKPETVGVLYELDCPGGTLAGSLEMHETVRRVAAKKPSWALACDMICSAAWYIAAACERVISTPTGMVGSIGTLSMAIDDSAMFDKLGLVAKPISSDPAIKPVGYPGVKHTPEWDAERERRVMQHYNDVFVPTVAAGRKMTADRVQALRAGTYPAPDALANGLIDAVHSRTETLAAFRTHLTPPAPINPPANPPTGTTNPTASGSPAAKTSAPAVRGGLNQKRPPVAAKETAMDMETLRKEHPELVGQIEREAAEAALAAATIAPPAPEGPATFDSLMTAYGAKDKGFVAECFAGKKTLTEAHAAWGQRMEERATAAEAAADRAAKAAQINSGTKPVEPVGFKAGGTANAGGRHEFLRLVDDAVAATKQPLVVCMGQVARQHPALHAKYIEEANTAKQATIKARAAGPA